MFTCGVFLPSELAGPRTSKGPLHLCHLNIWGLFPQLWALPPPLPRVCALPAPAGLLGVSAGNSSWGFPPRPLRGSISIGAAHGHTSASQLGAPPGRTRLGDSQLLELCTAPSSQRLEYYKRNDSALRTGNPTLSTFVIHAPEITHSDLLDLNSFVYEESSKTTHL